MVELHCHCRPELGYHCPLHATQGEVIQADEIERVREALAEMVYETTHLSPERPDGSHECRISAEALAKARAALADSPGLAGYDPARKAGASGYKWLVGAINPEATEAEKLRLELYCMNERRKAQVEQTRHYRQQIEAMERTLKFCYALLAPRSDANAIIAANPERAREAHRAIYERRPRDEPYDAMMARAALTASIPSTAPEDPWFTSMPQELADSIDTADLVCRALPDAALTTTAQGEVVQADRLREVMQDAWGEICDDTGCHPLDIRREGRKLFYDGGHWTSLIALRLNEALTRDHRLAFSHPSGEVERLREALELIATPGTGVPETINENNRMIARAALSTPDTVSLKGDRV